MKSQVKRQNNVTVYFGGTLTCVCAHMFKCVHVTHADHDIDSADLAEAFLSPAVVAL